MFCDGTQLRRGFELRNGWSFPLRYCFCGGRAPLSGSLGSGRLHTNGLFNIRAAVRVRLVGGRAFQRRSRYSHAAGDPPGLASNSKKPCVGLCNPEFEKLRSCIQLSRNLNECDHGYHSGSVHVLLQFEDLPVSKVHSSQYTAEWALRLSAVGPDLPAGPVLDESIRTRNDNQF
jgi:hypothetical protein